MEAIRSNSRTVIIDPVYKQVQAIRYQNHLRTLQNLKTPPKKCNSQYLVNKDNIAQQLNRYKKYQKQVQLKLNPTDVEYKNCIRRVNEIENSELRLPKITTMKLKENHLMKEQEKYRIEKENLILINNLTHIDQQRQAKRKELIKSIQRYQQYKKLSRRVKNESSGGKNKLKIKKES